MVFLQQNDTIQRGTREATRNAWPVLMNLSESQPSCHAAMLMDARGGGHLFLSQLGEGRQRGK